MSCVLSSPTRSLRTLDFGPSLPMMTFPVISVPSSNLALTRASLYAISTSVLPYYGSQWSAQNATGLFHFRSNPHMNVDALTQELPHLLAAHPYRVVRMDTVEQFASLAVITRKKIIYARRGVVVLVASNFP